MRFESLATIVVVVVVVVTAAVDVTVVVDVYSLSAPCGHFLSCCIFSTERKK